MLTSVTHGAYQELILWDLPNFRYMRDNVKLAADKIGWHDPICSGSEDVRAIWENTNIDHEAAKQPQLAPKAKSAKRTSSSRLLDSFMNVVNLSCDRLIRGSTSDQQGEDAARTGSAESFVIASDIRGFLRLFRYPSRDIGQAFYEARASSSPVNCCRFLVQSKNMVCGSDEVRFVSSSLDGSICLWTLD